MQIVIAGLVIALGYLVLAKVKGWPPFAVPTIHQPPPIDPQKPTVQTGPEIPHTPILPADAYARYMKCGGLDAARNDKFFQGGLTWYEILWLTDLAPPDRHVWAENFAGNETVDPTSYNTVAGIACTANVASYLMTLTSTYGMTF